VTTRSAAIWIGWWSRSSALRRLRNQMVHEYVEDFVVLADALNAAHDGITQLSSAAAAMRAEIDRRAAASS
jgi:predicted DNA-binding protein